jgi:hypothetical protein
MLMLQYNADAMKRAKINGQIDPEKLRHDRMTNAREDPKVQRALAALKIAAAADRQHSAVLHLELGACLALTGV